MTSWRKMPTRIRFTVIAVAVILAFVGLAAAVDVLDVGIGSAIVAGAVLIVFAVHAQAQHRGAVDGGRLKWLEEIGFTVEHIGRYWGYKGIHQGYFTRVHVDPTSRFHQRLGPDLCILVYFKPMRRPDGKRDIALLRRIESDLLNETNWVQQEFLDCHAIHMHQRTRFMLRTGRSRIQKHLDRVICMLRKHGLEPWPEAEVERWVRTSPDLHGPRLEEFQENFPRSEGGL